ncbi:MAG TPA: DUF1440 domain-containing protein [Clostridia bacterium]|nr:DUF1440 domain-containing protein [Clostridia bacterium]
MAKGAAAGAIAGLAASWAMNQFMGMVARAVAGPKAGNDPQRRKFAIAEATREWQEKADPTGQVSDALAVRLLGRHLDEHERALAGPVVHYAFGALAGAGYGAGCEIAPGLNRGFGVPFAWSLWIAGDEIANPLLRLTPPPNRIPPASHAAQFASHIVYGVVLEGVRRAIRNPSLAARDGKQG